MSIHLSVGRILKRDHPARAILIFVVLWWLIGLTLTLLSAFATPGEGETDLALPIAFAGATAAITLAGAFFILWRVRLLRRVFATGALVVAEVAHLGQNSEDINYAVVVYRYEGRMYHTTNVTESAAEGNRPAVGESVELIVDPRKPSRAYILRLFG